MLAFIVQDNVLVFVLVILFFLLCVISLLLGFFYSAKQKRQDRQERAALPLPEIANAIAADIAILREKIVTAHPRVKKLDLTASDEIRGLFSEFARIQSYTDTLEIRLRGANTTPELSEGGVYETIQKHTTDTFEKLELLNQKLDSYTDPGGE